MFIFFKSAIYIAVALLFLLGLITLSDVIIHENQVKYHVITIIVSAIFFGTGMVGIIVYKNFENIHDYFDKEFVASLLVKVSLRKLLLLFGITALLISLISGMVGFALIERMIGGTALFG